MLKRSGRPTFVALALTFGAVTAAVADGYIVTDLGTLTGRTNSWVWQQSINEQGVIAAYANDIANPNAFFGDVPFLWHRGRITALPELPEAVDTTATSLNDSGQVVGWSQPDGEGPHAVLWEKGNHRRLPWQIRTLGELPADIPYSHAYAINNHRQAVGDSCRVLSFDPFAAECQAVLWQKGRLFVLPPLPGGGTADFALDISERGQIVGSSGPAAALWHRGRPPVDLGLIGGEWAQALSINNKGQVVGLAGTAEGDTHVFFWENGVISDLGSLGGDVFAGAWDINERGQIVGFSART